MEENLDVEFFVSESGNPLLFYILSLVEPILFLHPHHFNLI
jgi:hypothetical protein